MLTSRLAKLGGGTLWSLLLSARPAHFAFEITSWLALRSDSDVLLLLFNINVMDFVSCSGTYRIFHCVRNLSCVIIKFSVNNRSLKLSASLLNRIITRVVPQFT